MINKNANLAVGIFVLFVVVAVPLPASVEVDDGAVANNRL